MAAIGNWGPTAATDTVVNNLQFINSIKFEDRSGQYDISLTLKNGNTKILFELNQYGRQMQDCRNCIGAFNKLDKVALLEADPAPADSTSLMMHTP